MIRSIAFACAAGVASLGGAAAWAQTPASAPARPAMSASSAAAALSRADSNFLRDAAQGGLAEVEGSKLAVEKGVNTQVKGFAQQMIDDHGKAGQELAALASSKGVTLPTKPSIAQTARIRLLSAKAGSSFDRQYADVIGVKAHQDTVKLFQKAANEAADPDVKAFAAKTLPTLENHLKMAREVKVAADKQGNVKAPGDRKL